MVDNNEIPIVYATLVSVLKEAIITCSSTDNKTDIWQSLLWGSTGDDCPIKLIHTGYPTNPYYLKIAQLFYLKGINNLKFPTISLESVRETTTPINNTAVHDLVGCINDNVKVVGPCFGPEKSFFQSFLKLFSADVASSDMFYSCSCSEDMDTFDDKEYIQIKCFVEYESEISNLVSIPKALLTKCVNILKSSDDIGILTWIGMRRTVGTIPHAPPTRSSLEKAFNDLHRPNTTSILTVGARYVSYYNFIRQYLMQKFVYPIIPGYIILYYTII